MIEKLNQESFIIAVLSSTHGAQHFFKRIIPPLIPLLVADLGLPLWKLGFLVTIQSLGGGVSQGPIGLLADRFDRRYILPTGVLTVGVGYLVFAASTLIGGFLGYYSVAGFEFGGTYLAMAIGIALSGIGRSATHPAGYPLMTANFDEDKGGVLGKWSGAAKIGDAVAPAAVAVLIIFMGWEGVFGFMGLLALVYGLTLFAYMSYSRLETRPPEKPGDGDEAELGDYLFPLVMVFLFSITVKVATSGIGTYLPEYISKIYGYTLSFAGFTLGPESVASGYYSVLLLSAAFATFYTGSLCNRFDPRKIMVALLALATVSVVSLSFLNLTPFNLLLVAVLMGATLFSFSPVRDSIITRVAPETREGSIFGFYWTAFLLAGAAYPTIIGFMSDAFGIRQSFKFLGVATVLAAVPMIVLYYYRGGDWKLS